MSQINPLSSVPSDVRKQLETAFGFVPTFMRTLPPEPTRQWWAAMRDFEMSDKTALPPKVKELVGLGVASQIPCHYCVLFHTEAARLNGASETEIQETIYMASLTRQGSTILNGAALDPAVFDKELRDVVAYLKTQASLGKGAR